MYQRRVSYFVILPDTPDTQTQLCHLGFNPLPLAPTFLYYTFDWQTQNQIERLLSSLSASSRANSQFAIVEDDLGQVDSFNIVQHARPLTLFYSQNPHDWFPKLMARQEIFADYQPIFDLETGDYLAYECLAEGRSQYLTFNHNQLRAAATVTGLSSEFDVLMSELCLQQAKQVTSKLPIWMTVSPTTLADKSQFRANLLKRTHQLDLLRPNIFLGLSLPEIPQQMPDLQDELACLREWGFEIALDDVCTQKDILENLYQFMPHAIRLNGGDLQRAIQEPNLQKSLACTVAVAKDLGMVTLAKQVNSIEALQVCDRLSLDLAQGAVFGCNRPHWLKGFSTDCSGNPLPPFTLEELS
jgi:EAL domain-containing protein (putative c-di-GMP-specific phosphodiesterase class I)